MADKAHGDDTLFESDDASDNDSPDASTDEETSDDSKESTDTPVEENTKDDLDLDEGEDKAHIQERKRKQEEDAWWRKIERGEKTLDDLPTRQDWLKPILEKRVKQAKKAKEAAEKYDVDALLDQKLAERESERTFIAMKNALSEASFTAAQKQEISVEYKDFREAGLPKDKALAKALRIVNIELPDTDALRRAMALPKAGRRDIEDKEGETDPRKKYARGSKERLKALNDLASQSGL